MTNSQTAKLLADLRKELAHPVMAYSGSGEVDRSLLERCVAYIEATVQIRTKRTA